MFFFLKVFRKTFLNNKKEGRFMTTWCDNLRNDDYIHKDEM